MSYCNHRSAQPQFGEVESRSSPDAQLCTAVNGKSEINHLKQGSPKFFYISSSVCCIGKIHTALHRRQTAVSFGTTFSPLWSKVQTTVLQNNPLLQKLHPLCHYSSKQQAVDVVVFVYLYMYVCIFSGAAHVLVSFVWNRTVKMNFPSETINHESESESSQPQNPHIPTHEC